MFSFFQMPLNYFLKNKILLNKFGRIADFDNWQMWKFQTEIDLINLMLLEKGKDKLDLNLI